jgi:hypothetical protein
MGSQSKNYHCQIPSARDDALHLKPDMSEGDSSSRTARKDHDCSERREYSGDHALQQETQDGYCYPPF